MPDAAIVVGSSSGSALVPLGFQAGLTDSASGLVLMGARAYDPGSGRFTQADSVIGAASVPTSFNRYVYAFGSPTNWVDPSGHWPVLGDLVSKVVSWASQDSSGAAGDAVAAVLGTVFFPGQAGDFVHDGGKAGSAGGLDSKAAGGGSSGFGGSAGWGRSGGGSSSAGWSFFGGGQSSFDSGLSGLGAWWDGVRRAGEFVGLAAELMVPGWAGVARGLGRWVVDAVQRVDPVWMSVAADVVVTGGCLLATAGVGSLGCGVVGGFVGGEVYGALTCPHGDGAAECMLGSSVLGAVSGLFGGVVGSVVGRAVGKAAGFVLKGFDRGRVVRIVEQVFGLGDNTGRTSAKTGDEAFHYTSSKWIESITTNGLNKGAYATPNGSLSPLQASLELALPPNRALPDAVLRIDLAGLRKAGYDIPTPTRVSSTVSSGRRTYSMPGGGYEMQFPYAIPPEFIKVVPR
ncbi:MAG TPA: RHS repeat-associated core domain-containing protein [Propionicimonas sp.]|nr:RHS repeat-associated core domain-containing protein [Propionicimonas sp.]